MDAHYGDGVVDFLNTRLMYVLFLYIKKTYGQEQDVI